MPDGTELALNIQCQNILDRIEPDIVLLKSIAEWIEERWHDLRLYNPIMLVDDFSVQIKKGAGLYP